MTLLAFGDSELVFFDHDFSYLSIICSFISLFIGIIMTQSGLDKIFNWEGELDFMTEKFSKTIIANFSTFGLIQVTILETLSGLLSLLGSIMTLFYDDESYGIMGLILAAVSFCVLMAGQRISKDYEGSAVLVPYFLLTMIGLFMYSS
ncbi:MAG: hypothetical protein NZ842_06080 [Dehalococcoidia bacterium]|nr:hypothetical protein [Dehalococcoidia bacterium]